MKTSYPDLYKKCRLCPRNCGTDRTVNNGACGESSSLSISSYLLHHGEEPCISFKNGSGTIFFTGCSLRCPFCQNRQISQDARDKKFYSVDRFINVIKELIDMGAENINFVTPDHFMPHIAEAAEHFKDIRADVPFVYNCSGYETVDHLKAVIDHMDIFLIDYKFADKEAAAYCAGRDDYPEVAAKALDYLFKKSGDLILDDNGKALKGVLVRHLVMPSFVENSISVVNNLYFDHGNRVYLSLMSQYSPRYSDSAHEKIKRRVNKNEYETIANLVRDLGFENGYIQEFIDYEDEYLPDFKKSRIFNAQNSPPDPIFLEKRGGKG